MACCCGRCTLEEDFYVSPVRRRRGIYSPYTRRRGQKEVLEVNPARLMFDKAVQDAELEDELLTRHEQRSLGINEKRHIVNLHRTHNYNVANIECATSHHRDRHCDEYFDYRKEMRRKMIVRWSASSILPLEL